MWCLLPRPFSGRLPFVFFPTVSDVFAAACCRVRCAICLPSLPFRYTTPLMFSTKHDVESKSIFFYLRVLFIGFGCCVRLTSFLAFFFGRFRISSCRCRNCSRFCLARDIVCLGASSLRLFWLISRAVSELGLCNYVHDDAAQAARGWELCNWGVYS